MKEVNINNEYLQFKKDYIDEELNNLMKLQGLEFEKALRGVLSTKFGALLEWGKACVEIESLRNKLSKKTKAIKALWDYRKIKQLKK
jgi:hypothetical protein